jgi:hypothetical protein
VSRVTGRRRHDVNWRDRNARAADRRGRRRRSRVPASKRRRSQRLLGLAGRRRALADAQRHVEHFLVEGQFLAQQAAAVVLHYRTIGANSGTDEMKNKKEKENRHDSNRFPTRSQKFFFSIIFNEAPLIFSTNVVGCCWHRPMTSCRLAFLPAVPFCSVFLSFFPPFDWLLKCSLTREKSAQREKNQIIMLGEMPRGDDRNTSTKQQSALPSKPITIMRREESKKKRFFFLFFLFLNFNSNSPHRSQRELIMIMN